MTREILFRARHVHISPQNRHLDGTWVYGYPCDKDHINTIDEDEYGERYTSEVLIDPETICEYTGMDDENGRKTFEGDIFQASDGDHIQTYIIVWDEDALGWSAECVGDPDGTLPLSEFRIEGIGIIGNIFDDPGLIERGGAAG